MKKVQVSKDRFIDYVRFIDSKAFDLLTEEKSDEYSLDDADQLSLENYMGEVMGTTPEKATMALLAKHIAALFILMDKFGPMKISLNKLNERIADACNMLKILGSIVVERRRNEDGVEQIKKVKTSGDDV